MNIDRKSKDYTAWFSRIGLVLSIFGLAIHGFNFYLEWYVPPRAQLSILVESVSSEFLTF